MHLFLFKITAKTIKKHFMWSQFPSYHSISLFPFTAKLTVKVLPIFTSSLLPDSFFKSVSIQVSHLRVHGNNSCDNQEYPRVPFITQRWVLTRSYSSTGTKDPSIPSLGFLDPTLSSSSSYFADGRFSVSFAGFSSYKLLKFHSPFLCHSNTQSPSDFM